MSDWKSRSVSDEEWQRQQPQGGDDWRVRSEPAGPAQPETPSELESFGRAALEGASLSFDDELGAGLQAALAKLSGGDFTDTYEQARYENRDEKHRARAANPKSYVAGNLTGAVFSPANALTAGLAGAPASTMVASGLAQGGLAAIGANENPDTLIPEVMMGAGLGGAVGAAAPEVGRVVKETVLPAAEATSNAARTLAGWMALKATGATGSNFRNIAKNAGHDVDRPIEVGLELLDRGAIPKMGTAAGIRERLVSDVLPGVDAERSAAIDAVKRAGVETDLPQVAASLHQKLAVPRLTSRLSRTRELGEDIQTQLGEIGGGTAPRRAPFDEAERVLQQTQELAYKMKDPAAQLIAPPLRTALRESADQAPGEAAAAYRAAKDSEARLLAAKSVLDDRVPMMDGNSVFPLSSVIAGTGTGAASGNWLAGVAAGVGVKVLKDRGPALAAHTFNRMSQALRAAPDTLGRWAPALTQALARSPEALMVTHRALMTTDPEYYEAWARQAEAENVR